MECTIELPTFNLQPGETCFIRRPGVMKTILGSCIGVTLWDPVLGAAAMCHGVLPRYPKECTDINGIADGKRYVDFSIRYLLRKFDKIGAIRTTIQVKVFGGASVLAIQSTRNAASIGDLNCRVALDVLEEEGLHVSASDVGGVCGRSIVFHTDTGVVQVRRLSSFTPV